MCTIQVMRLFHNCAGFSPNTRAQLALCLNLYLAVTVFCILALVGSRQCYIEQAAHSC